MAFFSTIASSSKFLRWFMNDSCTSWNYFVLRSRHYRKRCLFSREGGRLRKNGKITSINAAWPGGAHDAHVFRSSALCTYLEQSHKSLEDGVLLGDSGYPCRPFLLTPYLNPANAVQERFNSSHTRTRSCIERLFGTWKRRFHILHTEVRMKPQKCSKIIIACAVLHNLAKLWGEPDVIPEADEQDPPSVPFSKCQMKHTASPHLRFYSLHLVLSVFF